MLFICALALSMVRRCSRRGRRAIYFFYVVVVFVESKEVRGVSCRCSGVWGVIHHE